MTELVVRNELGERARLAGFELQGIEVRSQHSVLDDEITRLGQELRARFSAPPAAATWLEPARMLYRAFGIDPSRRRPSSEALLRRILQGKGLFTVNTAVDAANLASLRIALPVGLYDRAQIETEDGRVVLRLGAPEESYPGIRKDDIHVTDRPTLVDDLGPFGNPSSDSARTQVTLGTRHLLFVIYAPTALGEGELRARAAVARATLFAAVGGSGAEPWIA